MGRQIIWNKLILYIHISFFIIYGIRNLFEFYEVIIWIRNHSSSIMSLVHILIISRHRFTGSQKFSLVSLELYESRYIFLIEEKNIQKYSMQSKIVLPVCFDIIRMIFYYHLQNFSISLWTNSVFYPNYIQKQGKRFSLILFLNNIGFLLLSGEVWMIL